MIVLALNMFRGFRWNRRNRPEKQKFRLFAVGIFLSAVRDKSALWRLIFDLIFVCYSIEVELSLTRNINVKTIASVQIETVSRKLEALSQFFI